MPVVGLPDMELEWSSVLAAAGDEEHFTEVERTVHLAGVHAAVLREFIHTVRGSPSLMSINLSDVGEAVRARLLQYELDERWLVRARGSVLRATDYVVRAVYRAFLSPVDTALAAGYEERVRTLYSAVPETPGLRATPAKDLAVCGLTHMQHELTRIFMLTPRGTESFTLREELNRNPNALRGGQALALYRRFVTPVGGGEETPVVWRLLVLRTLALVDAVTQTELALEAMDVVPVLGLQNAGKSSLLVSLEAVAIQFGWGNNTRLPSVVVPARSGLRAEKLPRPLYLLDFPAATHGQGVYRGLGLEIMQLARAAVVIVPAGDANTSTARDLVASVVGARPGVRVLVLINHVDELHRRCLEDALRDSGPRLPPAAAGDDVMQLPPLRDDEVLASGPVGAWFKGRLDHAGHVAARKVADALAVLRRAAPDAASCTIRHSCLVGGAVSADETAWTVDRNDGAQRTRLALVSSPETHRFCFDDWLENQAVVEPLGANLERLDADADADAALLEWLRTTQAAMARAEGAPDRDESQWQVWDEDNVVAWLRGVATGRPQE